MSGGWKKLPAKDIAAFIKELSHHGELWIPRETDGRWELARFSGEQEVRFPPNLIDVSAKGLFFPKRRVIATYDAGKRWSLNPVEPEAAPRIIMGLKPCDVAALLHMDRVFLDSERKDRLYEAERERTTIIGLAFFRILTVKLPT